MTKKTIEEIGELETVAEKADGYVEDLCIIKSDARKECEVTIVP